jgi:hypothetical protein
MVSRVFVCGVLRSWAPGTWHIILCWSKCGRARDRGGCTHAQAWCFLGARFAARLALTFYACPFRSAEREQALAALAQAAHQDEALRAAAIDMLRDMEPKTLLSSFCCFVAVGLGQKTQYELYATAAKADPACAQAFSRMGDIRWEL